MRAVMAFVILALVAPTTVMGAAILVRRKTRSHVPRAVVRR